MHTSETTARATFRVGIGHDTHRLAEGGPLRIGGEAIPFDRHLVGHSDADVLLHAVTDAILGAAGLGDIGDMFPDTDPANRDRDSTGMLLQAHQRASVAGFTVVNLDCIIFAEQPRLGSHKLAIARRIAALLGLDEKCVGVKAKTGEHVGPIGRQEAIAAECVALLSREFPAANVVVAS